MACNPEVLKRVPLFALLDDEEMAVLAGQVELKKFAPRQRIYKIGDQDGQAYVTISAGGAYIPFFGMCAIASRDHISARTP